MRFASSRFGELEVDERGIIRFKKGILGFEAMRRYVLLPHQPQSAFFFLHSIDDPDLCFVVTDPFWFRPDYRVEMNEDDMRELEVASCGEVSVYAIVTVPKNPREMTANLLAPLLVNAEKGYAKQRVQRDSAYRTRHLIADEIRRAESLAAEREPAAAGAGSKFVMVG